MILAAGTLVVLGLAMFVAGLATGATAFFWGCVAVCVVAAVLLVVARRQMRSFDDAGPDEGTAVPATAVVAAVTSEHATSERAAVTGGRRTAPREAPESLRRTGELPAVPPPARTPVEEPATAEAPAVELPADEPPVVAAPPSGATAFGADGPPTAGVAAGGGTGEPGEPPMEEVEVTDLLLIVDLKDEVLVIDEHPRYHLPGCPVLAGQETIPLPLDEARTDGFTPCGVCAPDSTLAERERDRKHR